MALKVLLLQAGYPTISEVIHHAYNGKEAVDKIKEAYYKKNFSYGLILMDCSMPVLDGYEASDQIRSFYRENIILQPMIVACTGHTEEEFVQKAWRHQMDEILPKPIDFEALKLLLREVI